MDDGTVSYLPPPQTQPQPPGTVLSYAYYLPQLPPQPPPAAIPTQHYYCLPRQTIHLPQPHDDEVRTLFDAGFPDDVMAREIYNLFREFPGYESSLSRTSGENSQPFAFAVFLDQQSAVAAMPALNGMVFDLEKKCTLYIDLAKSNSTSKRPRDDERQGFDKRAKVSVRYSSATHGSGFLTLRQNLLKAHRPHVLHSWTLAGIGSTHLPGIHNPAYSTIGYPTAQSYVIFEDQGIKESATAMMSTSAPPCPTLFVANLGPRCTENELFQVLSRCPGFEKVKVQVKHGGPVAFAGFKGYLVFYWSNDSSPAGEGLRLEYARSRMGMRGKGK